MNEPRDSAPDDRLARIEQGIRVLREGHGANCSSIGSVIDTIFASAVVGGTIFAAVVASLGHERVRVVGRGAYPDAPSTPPTPTPPQDEESRR